jgi:tetratricopeptide (TPR) repeat protein
MKVFLNCDEALPLRFKLPTILDIDTLGGRLRTIGGEASHCLKNETFLKHIQEAIRYLEIASGMDPTYLPSRINLSSALVMAGEYAKVMGIVDEVLKNQPENPGAMNNKAIALYLFGKADNIDTADHAIGILKEISAKNPSFSDAFYNMASIQSERGRTAAAIETWKRFLKIEPTGVYAQVAKEKLGIKSDDKTPMKRASEMKSPIKLGDIKGETEKVLKGLKKKEFTIGEFKGEIYEAKNIKFLTIDNTVEIVEEETNKPINLSEFYKTYGEPVRKIKNLYGMTLIYNNFGVDVVDGGIKKRVYFKREGL